MQSGFDHLDALYRAAALSGAPAQQLRGYQKRVLQRLADGENLIMVAPPGAGKTEVALQHALAMLKADNLATTLFLVPNVTLAIQQAGERSRNLCGARCSAACQ